MVSIPHQHAPRPDHEPDIRDAQRTINRLRDELDTAHECIWRLRRELGATDDRRSWIRLRKSENRILNLLLARTQISKESLMVLLYEGRDDDQIAQSTILSVHICHLRRKLRPFGITIHNIWGHGWQIMENSKQIIRNLDQKNVP